MIRRRLLVSLFNPEEVRAAVAGGADILDCEDARAEVGMFKPRTISDIAFAARQNEGSQQLRISANIGFGLLLYRRTSSGGAAARTFEEIQAKAAQEALGMAASMDTGDHRPNIVKFGIDGVIADRIRPLGSAVKDALKESYRYQDHQVICGILETDLAEWNKRKSDKNVIRNLLNVGQFYFDPDGELNIRDFLEREVADRLMQGVTKDPHANLVEPYLPSQLELPDRQEDRLKYLVEEISGGGADGVMIDTPVSAKMARICLVKHERNSEDASANQFPSHGVFEIETLKKHSDYCQYNQCESWLAGSIQPHHARELAKIDSLDVVLCRGAAAAAVSNPYYGGGGGGARFEQRINAHKVQAMLKAITGEPPA